jgi:serine/threonine protein kinase
MERRIQDWCLTRQMYELLEEKGIHYITMEYVPGQDLKGLIRQSAPISAARTIAIAKQICVDLFGAHSQARLRQSLCPKRLHARHDLRGARK